MDQGGYANHFPAIRFIHHSDQSASVGRVIPIAVTFRRTGIRIDQLLSRQVLQEPECNLAVHIQPTGHFVSLPQFRPAIPQQEQGLKMRHAVDLVQKELADLRIVLAIVGHHLSGTDWRSRPATQAGATPGGHTWWEHRQLLFTAHNLLKPGPCPDYERSSGRPVFLPAPADRQTALKGNAE